MKFRLTAGKEVFAAFEGDLSCRRLGIIEAQVNRFGRYFDLIRKLPRDEQGKVPKWALAKRNRLEREIDPEDLLPFLKLAAQPSRPDMRNLVRPKLSFDAAKAQYEPLHLGHDYSLFGLLA